MSIEVAVDGMTAVYTSSGHVAADTGGVLPQVPSGSWGNTSFVVIKGTKWSVSSKKVELSATATWLYTGGISGPPSAPVPIPPIPDSASLTASTTKVKDKGANVLRKGDKATGTIDSDNYIEVDSGQTKLKSA